MKHFILTLLTIFLPALLWISVARSVPEGVSSPRYDDVKSIFEDNCIMCHNGPKAPKGLQLTSYESVLAGSKDGPVVHPGDPEGSELAKRIRGISNPRMPLTGPPWLSDDEIALIEQWIEEGAKERSVVQSETQADKLLENKPVPKKTGVTYGDVASIFKINCVKCHAERGLMGSPPENLLLNSYENILDSRDRARVVSGNSDACELIRRIRGQSLPRMPFDGPPYLNENETKLVETWVAQGAMDSNGRKAEIPEGARVRLHGRLTHLWMLDGLPLQMTGRSEIKKRTSLGDYVEVRGEVVSEGAIAVERIRER